MPKENITAKEAKAIDLMARQKYGISTLVLMENAGLAVSMEVMRLAKGKKRVALICGKGNNGGDGFVCARHLLSHGIKPDIFLAGAISDVRNEARANLDILIKIGAGVVEVNSRGLKNIRAKIKKYDIIIDALLGVGVSGDVRGVFKDLIRIINSAAAYIISVDVPSGLDATTGEILGCCVKADETITFIAKKAGMVRGQGPKVCKKVIVAGLGVPL